jgi:hypothetical protein
MLFLSVIFRGEMLPTWLTSSHYALTKSKVAQIDQTRSKNEPSKIKALEEAFDGNLYGFNREQDREYI